MTYTNRSETVLKLQIIPIYFLGENHRNSPFSVVELFEGKVVEDGFFFQLLMAINRKPKNENVWCIFLDYKLSQSYHLALVSGRIMQVTKARKSSAVCCQNHDKLEPLLLAYLTR